MSRIACSPLLFYCCLVAASGLSAQEDQEATVLQPTLKFFYFDEQQTEWVVSSDESRLQDHLTDNEDSANLFASLQRSMEPAEDLKHVRSIMTNWLEDERSRFSSTGGRNTQRIRVAESVTAYLRVHDFKISQLMEALIHRSGAEDVELAAVHLIDGGGKSAYKLKVMLPADQIDIDKQGFDVTLTSSEVTYASVVYALAIALYGVHEIINAEQTDEPVPEETWEELPVPESLPLPTDRPPPQSPLNPRSALQRDRGV